MVNNQKPYPSITSAFILTSYQEEPELSRETVPLLHISDGDSVTGK